MSRRSHIKDEELQGIISRHVSGYTFEQIAKEFSRNTTVIQRKIRLAKENGLIGLQSTETKPLARPEHEHALDSKDEGASPLPTPDPNYQQCSGGQLGTPRRPFDSYEIHDIERLLREKKKVWEIAQILKRSPDSVATEIKRNGGCKNYRAEAAIERRRTNQVQKAQKLSEDGKITHSLAFFLDALEKKVETIEQQIEILFDLLKERK